MSMSYKFVVHKIIWFCSVYAFILITGVNDTVVNFIATTLGYLLQSTQG